jgi:hypothetical protein
MYGAKEIYNKALRPEIQRFKPHYTTEYFVFVTGCREARRRALDMDCGHNDIT